MDICRCGYSDMDIWIYGYMDIWIYGYMHIWIYGYGYMDLWIYGYMDTWIWIYVDVGLSIRPCVRPSVRQLGPLGPMGPLGTFGPIGRLWAHWAGPLGPIWFGYIILYIALYHCYIIPAINMSIAPLTCPRIYHHVNRSISLYQCLLGRPEVDLLWALRG